MSIRTMSEPTSTERCSQMLRSGASVEKTPSRKPSLSGRAACAGALPTARASRKAAASGTSRRGTKGARRLRGRTAAHENERERAEQRREQDRGQQHAHPVAIVTTSERLEHLAER